MIYRQYDVVLVDFGDSIDNSEQSGIRPALICQNNIGNEYSPTTIVMPFTSKYKSMYLPTHTLIKSTRENGLSRDSVLLGECLRQISEQKIIRKIGSLSTEHEKSSVKRVYLANWEVETCH